MTAHATGEVVGQIIDRLGAHPDLAVLVASPSHVGALEDAAAAVRSLLAPTVLLGWVATTVATDTGLAGPTASPGPRTGRAGGLVGGAVGLWAAHTGPAAAVRLPELTPAGWAEMGPRCFEPRSVVMVGTSGVAPDSGPPGLTLAGAVSDVAGAPIVLDGTAYSTGAVGVVLGPGIDLTMLVEQGRRPVGAPTTVTRTDGVLLVDLDDRPAMSALMDIAHDQVPAGDIALINRSLHLEVASVLAGAGPLHAIRGRDATTGALVTEPEVKVGDVVQFWVRDPDEAVMRTRQLVDDAEGGALVWRTRPSGVGEGTDGRQGERRRSTGRATTPTRPLLACGASALLGVAGTSRRPADHDTIGIGLFREPRVALG